LILLLASSSDGGADADADADALPLLWSPLSFIPIAGWRADLSIMSRDGDVINVEIANYVTSALAYRETMALYVVTNKSIAP